MGRWSMDKLVAIFVLAAVIEGVVELFGQFVALVYPGDSESQPAQEYERKLRIYTRLALVVSTGVGVVFCFWGRVGILELLDISHSFPEGVDYALTGVLIGRGSKSVHDFVRMIDGKKEQIKR
jgi:hypothetical protein